MKVEIKQVEAQPIIAWRHVGPYHEVGESFQQLHAWIYQNELYPYVTGGYGLSYDDPESVPEAELRYDACVSLRSDAPVKEDALPAEARRDTLPGGRYACGLLEGSYAGMQDLFHRMFGLWLPDSGEELDERPCLEWYLNDPSQVAEADLRTLVCIPIKG